MSKQQPPLSAPAGSFSDRIKLLIQRVGSATEIARMCGFSEGVVRSWRDGNTDPSRARCVTLARTLGISLVWLVAGEGTIQVDPSIRLQDEQKSGDTISSQRQRTSMGSVLPMEPHARASGVDAQRLNTAMRILQSELDLADSRLTLTESADMLTELYEILGPNGVNVDTRAMMKFNHRLGERIRRNRDIA